FGAYGLSDPDFSELLLTGWMRTRHDKHHRLALAWQREQLRLSLEEILVAGSAAGAFPPGPDPGAGAPGGRGPPEGRPPPGRAPGGGGGAPRGAWGGGRGRGGGGGGAGVVGGGSGAAPPPPLHDVSLDPHLLPFQGAPQRRKIRAADREAEVVESLAGRLARQ